MNHLLSKIWKSSSARNVGKLLSANVFAQAIGLIVYPFLTRMYAPEDFGLLNLFVSVGGIIVLLSTMEYQYAILLAKEQRTAVAAVQLSTVLTFLWIAVLLVLLPFGGKIAGLFHVEQNTSVMWWLPLFVAGGAGWNIVNMYLTRGKCFSQISTYKVSNTLLMALGKLGFGGFGMTAVGLIVSTVAAPIVALGLTLRSRLWHLGKRLIHIEWQDLRKVAVEYKKFPIFSLPRALVNNIGTALPALLLVPAFGLGKMGLFSMAIMLSFTPITLIVNSVQQVLFQQVTERVHAGQPIRAMMRRITRYTLAGVVPFFALLYFPLPWMSGLLLGDEWRISGEYIRMMLPWLLMVCLNGPICFVADVFMAQGVGLIYECAILLARVAGLSVGIYLQRFDYAIMGYSVASTIVLIAQLVWYYRLIERYERTR